ncbi:MarR family winged helix-turn-helix transcriptional regulator [Paracoccus isoporae]|nr:MarR family transcriptional regulator [Paracoccus isoporae]
MPSYRLNHIVHQYQQTVQSRLRSVGVSMLKMRIIMSLRSYGQLTVSELCNHAIAEQPTMSRALDSLEQQGFVRREQSRVDSRLRLVTLTDDGRRVGEEIHPVIMEINARMTDGLEPEQREAFSQHLGQILNNLRTM